MPTRVDFGDPDPAVMKARIEGIVIGAGLVAYTGFVVAMVIVILGWGPRCG